MLYSFIMNKYNIKKYFLIFILSMIGGSFSLLPYVKYIFYDALANFLNASNKEIGFLLTVYSVVCILGYIPGGLIADKFSIKKIIVISAFSTGLLNIILAFYASYKAAIIIWGLLGITRRGFIVVWDMLLRYSIQGNVREY